MKLTEFKSPLIIAHRGYRAKYPENTLAAFQAALTTGAQMIELDVTLTRDRKLVVIHDDTLERTTTGKGAVRECTLEELKQMDAGICFGSRFAGECIPTLEEVLDRMAGRILINIEIKPECYEPHHPYDAVERQVTELVCQKNAIAYVLVSCTDWRIIDNIKKTEPLLPVALITGRSDNHDVFKICKRFRVFSWHPNYLLVNREKIDVMHRAGIRVFPYTVNSPQKARELFEMGADGVFTDDPPAIVQK